MLVSSRKQTEKVLINDSVVVAMLGIRGNTVRLGVEAPMEIPVHRGELRQGMRNPDVPGGVG